MGENIFAALSGLSGLLTSAPSIGIPILNALGQHMQGNTNTNASLNTLLEQMQSNPVNAATYAALIASLPNVPPGVLNEVNGAVALASNPTAYIQAIIAAKAELNNATSNSAIGGILAGLTLPAA
jgi:hypothetical protein